MSLVDWCWAMLLKRLLPPPRAPSTDESSIGTPSRRSLLDGAMLKQALAPAHTRCWRCAQRVQTVSTRTLKRRHLASTAQQVNSQRLLVRACAMRVMLGPTRQLQVLHHALHARVGGTLLCGQATVPSVYRASRMLTATHRRLVCCVMLLYH